MSDRPAYTHQSLNGGEVSKRFEARQDQNKYLASVSKSANWLPMVLGGVMRRDGSIYVTEAKQLDAVLIPFKFNAEQAYVCEFGDLYVRFYKDGAPIMDGLSPLELVTPYPTSMLRHIKMSAFQSADVMYIPSDGTLPVYKLRRTDDDPDTFDLVEVGFRSGATVEAELTGTELGGMTLTPGATTGDDITFTASSAVFLSADVGLAILGPNGGRAVINTVTDSTHVVADIIDPFPNTSAIAAADWSLRGTPSANIDPSKVNKGGAITIEADADVFRSAYEGKYILVYGGLVEVTQVKSATNLRGILLSDMIDRDLANPSETAFWSLEEAAWTEEEGYPTAGCFYQERMWLARGQTRWGSNSADFENFAKGSDDSAGIQRTISDDEINDILWIKASANGLFSATRGGIYRAVASQENGPLTPNDFNEAAVSDIGTERIAPIRIGGLLVYVQDGGKGLIEQAFNFVDNKFDSPDLLLLADHLTEFNTITALVYQKRPYSTVWAVRDDGAALNCTYRRAEQVVGWAPLVTDGEIKDICVIPRPSTSSDWVWQIVEREIDSEVRPYVEYYENFDTGICREWRSAQTDSAVFTTATDFIISGLDHLEGKTVRVIGDGMLFTDQVVTEGEVPVHPEIAGIASFEVGLNYVSDGLTLEPIIPQERGGPLMARGWEAAGARVRRTFGLKINDEPIPFRQATDLMDQQIPLKRGKVVVTVQKCDGEGRISFVQDLPFPAEVLNIFGRVAISDEPFPFLIPEEEPDFFVACKGIVPEGCTDATERGQAVLTVEHRFVQEGTFGGATNLRTSWSFIGTGEEVYALLVDAGSGSGIYDDSASQINHFEGDDLSHPALVQPSALLSADTTRLGTSDEPAYGFETGGVFYLVYPTRNIRLSVNSIPHPFGIGSTQFWAKRGDFLYTAPAIGDFGTAPIGVYSSELGGDPITTWDTLDDQEFRAMAATATYLYCLTADPAGSARSVKKLLRSDGSLVASFDLTNLGPHVMSVVNDNLIYILSGTRVLYYIKNFSELVYVGSFVGSGFGLTGGSFFRDGAFYFGNNGFGGFGTNISKILVECPPDSGPVIASISTTESTVAAGASITANWADVLVPVVSDVIQLRIAPSAGQIATANPVISSETNTLGLGTGSLSFPIPGGTGAGNYILTYAPTGGNSFICASAPFAVT